MGEVSSRLWQSFGLTRGWGESAREQGPALDTHHTATALGQEQLAPEEVEEADEMEEEEEARQGGSSSKGDACDAMRRGSSAVVEEGAGGKGREARVEGVAAVKEGLEGEGGLQLAHVLQGADEMLGWCANACASACGRV